MTSSLDLPWENWIQILSYLPVQSVSAIAQTCHYLHSICNDPMLWRDLLRRDYSHFDGAIGLDLLRRQENSLTLSQSASHPYWGDAPWKLYYSQAFQSSRVESLAWVTRFIANMKARQDHAGARCGDYLIVYAGFTGDRSLYVLDTRAQVEKLQMVLSDSNSDIQSAKLNWHRCDITGQGPRFIGMLYGHSLVSIDHSTLLLFGGMQAPGYCFETSETWLLHLEMNEQPQQVNDQMPEDQLDDDNEDEDDEDSSDQVPFRWKWERPPITGITPPARAYHTAVVAAGKMWIFGGTWNSETHNDFWCLDLKTWTWSEVDVRGGIGPSDRMGHSCTVYGSNLIILGGSDSPYCQGDGEDYSDGYLFNIQTRTWRSLNPCPGTFIGRRHAAVLVGHRILVIAGSNPHTNSVGCFDLLSETWSIPGVQGKKPSPRVSLSAHFCNGLIFVFGGCTINGLSQELFLLDPSDYSGALRLGRITDGEYMDIDEEDDDFEDPRILLRMLAQRPQAFLFSFLRNANSYS